MCQSVGGIHNVDYNTHKEVSISLESDSSVSSVVCVPERIESPFR